MLSLPLRPNGLLINKLIQFNYYSFINGLNNIYHNNKWISPIWSNHNLLDNIDNNNNDNNNNNISIFFDGILFAKANPTSSRKYSKTRTRKRMSRVGFLARVRTFNGRKILLRQRRKGKRYLGAKV